MELSGTITETMDRRGGRTYIEVKYGNDFLAITVPSTLSDAFRKGETVVIQVQEELDVPPDVRKGTPMFVDPWSESPRSIRLEDLV